MPDFETVWITAATAFRLKKARVDKGISQSELAQRVAASVNQIEHYERGEVDMPMDRLFDLARVLDLPVSDLLAE
jgi:transcriptional regulator with XRE-family HTH domain